MSPNRKNPFPNSIRSYRRKKALRLYEVAHYAQLSSPAHLSHWEKGRKTPTLINALKLSAILQCPVEILFLDMFNQVRQEVHHQETLPIRKPL